MKTENEEIAELIEEMRAIEEEMENKYGTYLREHGHARIYPSRTVAGIPPDLARMLDLTEEEIRKYSV